MKKILIVTHSAGHGGAERVASILSNQFAENGFDVTFYAIHSDTREYYLDERVNYVFCNVKGKNKAFKQLERAWKLRKYILDNHIDVMISFVCLEGIFLLGNHKFKKIYSLRNDPTRILSSGLSKKVRDIIYRDADNIVFQTSDARSYFDSKIQQKGIIIADPIRNDLPKWNRDSHGQDIIAACRITEQKNLKMMIDAFEIFHQKNDKFRLVIYGQGDLLSFYKEYAEQKKLSDTILFAGFCNTIQEKMENAAMYVSSSDYEGISNSMLEALAIGTPSVCTDCPVGGAKMFIESGKSGFLVPVGNAEVMAEKMLQLAENEELQENFSRESQKIREQLSPENIYQMWESLI